MSQESCLWRPFLSMDGGSLRFKPLTPVQQQRGLYFITEVKAGSVTISDIHGNTRTYKGPAVDFNLIALSGHAVYSLVNPTELIHAGDSPAYWKAHKRHNRKVRMTYKAGEKAIPGLTVWPLAQFTSDPTELAPFFDAINNLGVKYNTLSKMAMDSWRRTLPCGLSVWAPPSSNAATRTAFTGGRREAIYERASFEATAYMDLPAAYLKAQAGPFPTRLQESRPGIYDSGIAQARVLVPEHDGWKPLPLTKAQSEILVTTYPTGLIHGCWTMEELQLAINAGYEVHVIKAWRGEDYANIFDAWLEWALWLRGVGGPSGKLAKAMTTRLWALFGINGNSSRTLITFDEKGNMLPSKSLPRGVGMREDTKFLSALIASRTRVNLARALDALAVWCDTDGVITSQARAARLEENGWKRKQEMSSLQLYDWAHIRWSCREGDRAHLGVSGCARCIPPGYHYRIDGIEPDSPDAEKAWKLNVPGEYWDTSIEGISVPSMPIEQFQATTFKIIANPLEVGI